MKKMLIINPVATSRWNESDLKYIKSAIGPDSVVDLENTKQGPQTIEFDFDVAFAQPEIIKIVMKKEQDYDGIMINCFDNPALRAVREYCQIPVVAPGESGITLASLLGHKFTIIAIRKKVIPQFERQVNLLGLERKLASVEHVDSKVSKIDNNLNILVENIVKKIETAVNTKGAEVAVLGCTGMVSLYREVKNRVDIPVIEPAAAAIKLLEMFIDLGITHSKVGLYHYPDLNKITGVGIQIDNRRDSD